MEMWASPAARHMRTRLKGRPGVMVTPCEEADLPCSAHAQTRLSHQSWKALCGRQAGAEEGEHVSGGQEERASEVPLGERGQREAASDSGRECRPSQPCVPVTLTWGALKMLMSRPYLDKLNQNLWVWNPGIGIISKAPR